MDSSLTPKQQMLLECIEETKAHLSAFTADRHDREDLIQDVAEKAFSNIDKIAANKTEMKKWLYTIMRNTYINGWRRKRKFNIVFPEHMESNSVSYNDGVSSLLIEEAMARLSEVKPVYKECYLLYISGHKYQEVADIKGVPINTINTYIRRARLHMKAA